MAANPALSQNRNWIRYDPNKKIDAALLPYWDHNKSPLENMRKLGLASNPNMTAEDEEKQKRKVANGPVQAIELFDIPQPGPSRRTRFPLTPEEEKYIAKCMAKHGDDYVRIFRDVGGVNDMQHTETHLRKLGTRFLALRPEQRREEVPSKVISLLQHPLVESTEGADGA